MHAAKLLLVSLQDRGTLKLHVPTLPFAVMMTRRKDADHHNNILVSKPIDFQHTSHVECDPQTGIYSGMDEFLALATTPRLRRSPTRLRDRSDATRRMPTHPRAKSPNLEASKPKLAPRYDHGIQQQNVTRPLRTRHEVHVRLDPNNPTGFAGLPRAWESILLVSGILRDEAMQNPEALVDVLNFSESNNDPSMASIRSEKTCSNSALPPIRLVRTPSLTSFDEYSTASINSRQQALGNEATMDTATLAALRIASVPSDEFADRRASNMTDMIPEGFSFELRRDDAKQLFSNIEQIGEGASGTVYRAVNKEGRFVALKRVRPQNKQDWQQYLYEVHVMQNMRSVPNLVDCTDAFRDDNHLWIVMELMSAGTLTDLLDTTEIEESVIAYICREVLKGLAALHALNRVHRDIKSHNTLLDMDGSVKVADFGLSTEITESSDRNTVVGTPFWMAPEVIRGSDYGAKVDIWSTGILALECAERSPPHPDIPPIRAMFLIATQGAPPLSKPDKWSEEMKDFIDTCCATTSAARPDAETALSHPFLEKACEPEYAATVFNEAKAIRMAEVDAHLSKQEEE